MAKGDKKLSLKKRLAKLERDYGYFFNSPVTPDESGYPQNPIYKTKNDFTDEQTRSEPERTGSSEIESLKESVDLKISGLKNEFKEDVTYFRTKLDDLNSIIRTEGNSLRTNFVTKVALRWVMGIAIPLLGGVAMFLYNRLDSDIQELDDDIKEVKNSVKQIDKNIKTNQENSVQYDSLTKDPQSR